MNCNDILERIGDYLDSELDGAERKQVRAHLESCAECQRAYTEVASIKRVVQTKIVRPPLPGALAGRVFRKTRSEAASRRTAVSVRRALPAIAALLLFGLTTFLVIRVWVIGELPLAHARAIKDMADKVGEFTEIPRLDPELSGKSSEQILQLIRERTGVQLDALPEIDKSCLLRIQGVEVLGRRCVRLDYRDHCVKKRDCPKSVFSVFALPLSEVEDPHYDLQNDLQNDLQKPLGCQCVQVKGLSIYCFRRDNTSMNLIRRVDEEDFSRRIKIARCETQGQAQKD